MIAIATLLLEIGFLAIIKSSGVADIGNVVATGLILIFSLAFAASVQNSNRLRKYANILICGYLFRVFLMYFDLYGANIFVLPNSGADTDMFYNGAVRYMEFGGTTRTIFPIVMGTIFRVIGQNRLYGQFLVMLCSIVSLTITALTLDDIDLDDETRMRVYRIVCLLPNFAILSSIFLREAIVSMFVTISVCLMVSWMLKGGYLKVLFAIISSMGAVYFHSGTIGITIGCLLTVMIYDGREQKVRLTGGHFILAIVAATGVAFIFLRYGDNLLGKFGNVDSLEDIANTSDIAGSSYARYVGNSNNPLNMAIYSLPRIIYFLFSPFPWQWRGISDIIAFFFSGLYYLVVIKDVITFLRSGKKRNRGMIIGLLLLAFFTTFIFAWGVSNTGTASRHRDKMVCLYGIIYALSSSSGYRVKEQDVNNIEAKQAVGSRYIR